MPDPATRIVASTRSGTAATAVGLCRPGAPFLISTSQTKLRRVLEYTALSNEASHNALRVASERRPAVVTLLHAAYAANLDRA